VDLSGLEQAGWLRPPPVEWGARPQFDPGAVLSFILAYLAVMVNATGSIFSIQPLVRPDHIDRRLNRGVAFTGLAGILSGLAGVIGTVPYSLSPGIITVTHVGSRFVLTVCGLMMIALAFFGKLAALLSAVPNAVVASSLMASIGAATGYSIRVIMGHNKSFGGREYMVVGLPVLLGVGVTLIPDQFMEMLPTTLRPILDNGLIVGVVIVLLLEHVIMPAHRKNG
jgi:xanthine/uracil permease